MVILYAHIVLIILSLIILLKSYRQNPKYVILNFFSYLLFGGVLYLCIPSVVFLLNMSSPLVGKLQDDEVVFLSLASLYTVFIFFIAFFISFSLSYSKKIDMEFYRLERMSKLLISIIAAFISFYILIIILMYFHDIIHAYGNRRLQSDINTMLIMKYKIYFLFYVLAMLSVVGFFLNRHYINIVLLAPYVVLDLLLSGREFMLMTVLLFLLMTAYRNQTPRARYIWYCCLFLLLVGIVRSGTYKLGDSFLEFLFTYSAAFLLLHVSYAASFAQTICHSILMVFPQAVAQSLYPAKTSNYITVMEALNPLSSHMGLGGSLIAEMVSFKSTIVIVIYPVLVCFYGIIANYSLYSKFIWSRAFGILSILMIHPIYRGSFFSVSTYPLKIMLFCFFWVLFLDIIAAKRASNFSTKN